MNGNELLQILGNLTNELGPFWDLIVVGAYLGGAVLCLAGLLMLLNNTQPSMFLFAAGVFLLSTPAVIDMVSETIFQESTSLGLSSTGGGGTIGTAVNFTVNFVRLIGLYSFVKGLFLLKNPQNSHSCIVHLVAGSICLNFVTAAQMVGRSAGGIVQDVISALIG